MIALAASIRRLGLERAVACVARRRDWTRMGMPAAGRGVTDCFSLGKKPGRKVRRTPWRPELEADCNSEKVLAFSSLRSDLLPGDCFGQLFQRRSDPDDLALWKTMVAV